MTKKIWLAATAAAFLLELTGTAVAGAQTTSQSIFVYVQGAFGGNQPTTSVVVASGALNAVGTDQYAPSQPGDPANVDRDTFMFPHGTLSSMVTKQIDQTTPLNACTVALKMAGTFQIDGGTGAYKGAHGSGTFTQQGIGFGAHLPSGGCSHDQGTYHIWGTDHGTLLFRRHNSAVGTTRPPLSACLFDTGTGRQSIFWWPSPTVLSARCVAATSTASSPSRCRSASPSTPLSAGGGLTRPVPTSSSSTRRQKPGQSSGPERDRDPPSNSQTLETRQPTTGPPRITNPAPTYRLEVHPSGRRRSTFGARSAPASSVERWDRMCSQNRYLKLKKIMCTSVKTVLPRPGTPAGYVRPGRLVLTRVSVRSSQHTVAHGRPRRRAHQ